MFSPPPPPAVERIRRHAAKAEALEGQLAKAQEEAEAARAALLTAEAQARDLAALLRAEHVALVKLLSDSLKDSHRQFYEFLEVLGAKMVCGQFADSAHR